MSVSDGRSPGPRSRPRAGSTGLRGWLVAGSLFVVVLVIHTLSRNPQVGDSRLSPLVAWRFFTHLDLHLESYPNAVLVPGGVQDYVSVDGHLLPFFPWPPMLLAAPADAVYLLLNPGSTIAEALAAGRGGLIEVTTAAVLVAVAAVLVMRAVLDRNPQLSTRCALVCALVFAFGTSAWSVGSRALWQQTVSMVCLLVAVLALHRLQRDRLQRDRLQRDRLQRDRLQGGRRWALLLGLALGAAVVVRPTNAVFVILVGVLLLWRYRSSILLVALGAIVVLGPFLLFSALQYGSVLPPYYLPSRLSDPARYSFWESLGVNLISPSRGLIFYDAVLLLAAAGLILRWRSRTFSSMDGLLAATVVGQLVVIAGYGSTHGFTYGPRLMLDIVPFLVLLAAPVIAFVPFPVGDGRRWSIGSVAVVAVLVWSFFVSATGGVLYASACWNTTPVSVDVDPGRVWDWSDPQFLRPYQDLLSGRSVTEVALSPTCAVG